MPNKSLLLGTISWIETHPKEWAQDPCFKKVAEVLEHGGDPRFPFEGTPARTIPFMRQVLGLTITQGLELLKKDITLLELKVAVELLIAEQNSI